MNTHFITFDGVKFQTYFFYQDKMSWPLLNATTFRSFVPNSCRNNCNATRTLPAGEKASPNWTRWGSSIWPNNANCFLGIFNILNPGQQYLRHPTNKLKFPRIPHPAVPNGKKKAADKSCCRLMDCHFSISSDIGKINLHKSSTLLTFKYF